MRPHKNPELGSFKSFHTAAWDRYSPTTNAPERVPDATLDQAMSEFQSGSKELAYEILSSHPNLASDANALNAAGVMEMFFENFASAERSFTRSISLLEKRKSVALANLATVHIYQRDWEKAEKFSEQATRTSSDVPHGWINLLFILARTAQYDKLLAEFDRMETEFPSWRECTDLTERLTKDTIPALGRNPTVKSKIETSISK